MRFIILLISISVFSVAAGYLLPWWMIAVVAFVCGWLVNEKGGRSFLAGFLGIALSWGTVAMLRDNANEHLLSAKMAALFHLPGYLLFVLVTMIVGGLIGGLSAWSGALIRKK